MAKLVKGSGSLVLQETTAHTLRAQHTLALRAELASRYAHGTANKHLA